MFILELMGFVGAIVAGICFRVVYLTIKAFHRIEFIEKFKYEESARQRQDIGSEKATHLWFQRGYEEKFNRIFYRHFINLAKLSSERSKTESFYKLYKTVVK